MKDKVFRRIERMRGYKMKQDVTVDSQVPNDLKIIGWYNISKRRKEIENIVDLFLEHHKNNPSMFTPGGHDAKEMQTVGVACECAFAEITGLKWEPFIEGVYTDNRVDFMIPEPYNSKVDVKGHSGGTDLLIAEDTLFNLHMEPVVFVSAVFDRVGWNVLFTGWVWTKEVYSRGRKAPDWMCPGKKTIRVRGDELNPMGRLMNVIRETQIGKKPQPVQESLL